MNMHRRSLLQASVAASTIPLAGCASLPAESSGSKANASLVGVTFFVMGTANRADGDYFYLDVSGSNGKVLKINVEDNAGPLIGRQTESGWTYTRHLGWESIPQDAQVVATVRKTAAGELEAVKILFHAICSFERPLGN